MSTPLNEIIKEPSNHQQSPIKATPSIDKFKVNVNKGENDSDNNRNIELDLPRETKYVHSTPNLRICKSSPPWPKPKPYLTTSRLRSCSDKHVHLEDLCCLALVCSQHQRLALINMPQKGLYFPYIACKIVNFSIGQLSRDLLHRIFGSTQANYRNHQLSTERIQLPNNNFITRCTYRMEVSIQNYTQKKGKSQQSRVKEKASCVCRRTTSRLSLLQWLSYQEICNKLTQSNQLLGPEPKYILEQIVNSKLRKESEIKLPPDSNLNQMSSWNEITIDDYICWDETNDPGSVTVGQNLRLLTGQMIKCCWPMNKGEITSIYNEYTIQCYPSRFMTYTTFKLFWEKLITNIPESRIRQYFKAFDRSGLSFLCFNELLLGLMVFGRKFQCCSSKNQSLCPCGTMKLEYMFRFFSNQLQLIDTNELVKSYNENLQRQQSGQNIVEKNPSQANEMTTVNFDDFQKMINNGQLFRSMGITTTITDYFDTILYISPCLSDFMLPIFRDPETLTPTQWLSLNHNSHYLKCDACKRNKFYLSSHFISLTDMGELSEVYRLDARADFVSNIHKNFRQDMQETNVEMLAYDIINRINKVGVNIFNPDELLQANTEQANLLENWFFSTKKEAIEHMKIITKRVEEILEEESRVLELTTPCFVIGDIHGYLKDLLLLAQNIWRSSPFINLSKYLFLGDYVDRGQYGVECIMYLFCMKIMAPENFFILRGNHEIREVQEQFSFCEECSSRFEFDLWECINAALDRLPISATIDGRMFCAHGGIPITINTVEQIRSVPNRIENPLHVSYETWQILWNDPISNDDLSKLKEFGSNVPGSQGMISNTKRGTAYLYTENDVLKFCDRNGTDFILRAHEVYEDGFHFHHHGAVLTVFSTANYSELTNHSAVLFVDQQKIRIIQIKDIGEE